jgi:hypothetical protein
MNYLKVRWIHEYPNEPTLLYSEIDAKRYEVRKVEVFADGSKSFASMEESCGDTILSELPLPPDDEIAANGQFVIEGCDARDFERVWSGAKSNKAQNRV